jgi:perosamine synthetase
MFTVVLDDELTIGRDEMMKRLAEDGIDTRPVVYPMHQLPPYRESASGQSFPVADHIAGRGINLPTWARMTRADVHRVCESLQAALASAERVR